MTEEAPRDRVVIDHLDLAWTALDPKGGYLRETYLADQITVRGRLVLSGGEVAFEVPLLVKGQDWSELYRLLNRLGSTAMRELGEGLRGPLRVEVHLTGGEEGER